MNIQTRQTLRSAVKPTGMNPVSSIVLSIVLPFSLTFLSIAHADDSVPDPIPGDPVVAGVIDTPPTSAGAAQNVEELQEQVSEEQEALAEKDREELERLAKQGQRLAQVELGADYADEAQQILYAPEAANSAISDALAWYSLAAQRGFSGTPSLNDSGVKFYPVRVIRNK